MHPLDRPVRGSLTGGWASLQIGDARASRLDPDHGPFAASADLSAEGVAQLATLPAAERDLWLVETALVGPPPGLVAARHGMLVQMVAPAAAMHEPPFDWRELGEDDAAEMLALARLTQPGPFEAKTHRLGWFVGVHDHGRLVAMAGERMRLPGFVEVSGVCTHPDHRRRGYAGGLMRLVAGRIARGGATPFLHVYADNGQATALYETLGFRVRRTMVLTVLARR